MSERMYVATRKGLFQLDRKKQKPGWEIGRTAFVGDNVSQVLADPRNEQTIWTGVQYRPVKSINDCDNSKLRA